MLSIQIVRDNKNKIDYNQQYILFINMYMFRFKQKYIYHILLTYNTAIDCIVVYLNVMHEDIATENIVMDL